MKLAKVIESIGTTTELKRVASAYVIDYRNLTEPELREAVTKTGPQYYFDANVRATLDDLFLSDDRTYRILSRMILTKVLLQKDDFMCPKRQTEDEIIAMEQAIINRSNEDLMQRGSERTKWIELFQFVVDTAWQHNDEISPDEKNLIEKIRERLRITDREYQIIEAKLGKFPKPGNELHTRGEIEDARRSMQFNGVLFAIRDDDNTDYDIIPEEVAETIRRLLGIEMRRHGYKELLSHKYVRSKAYLLDMLAKSNVSVERAVTLEGLQEICMEQVAPSTVLGGISPRDGLDIGVLRKWCSELDLNVSGVKADVIKRIIGFYDGLLEREEAAGDERQQWYCYYEALAARHLDVLRSQQVIQKDLECEAKFEQATNYLFETKLNHTPLKLVGTNHADGALSFQDKVILWDNKSKETPVSLKDHIRQFSGYIEASEREVACFFVIGPDFTPESNLLAMQYQVERGTTIVLITAAELKEIAEDWSVKGDQKKEDPFPLGYLIQPGRLNRDLVPKAG